MNMPFYVAPEQMMKDRADYAQKGIARGRSMVALVFDEGIAMVAENPSRNLRKISEIYDRLAFAGVGRYNEYDQLRIAGIRHADTKGYLYSREDVDSQALANQYAQMLGQIFTHEMKPMEVEILVAAVGFDSDGDRLFHIRYDGSVSDENFFVALGGEADVLNERLAADYSRDAGLAEAIKLAAATLSGPDRTLDANTLEVGILDRQDKGRCFRRPEASEIETLLA